MVTLRTNDISYNIRGNEWQVASKNSLPEKCKGNMLVGWHENPVDIYQLKVTIKTLEQGMKYVQS